MHRKNRADTQRETTRKGRPRMHDGAEGSLVFVQKAPNCTNPGRSIEPKALSKAPSVEWKTNSYANKAPDAYPKPCRTYPFTMRGF